MKTVLSLFVFLSFLSFSTAQSDEINISAAFAQSIELRVIGNTSVNFSFTTLDHYTDGMVANRVGSGFEVASSTSFEVQASFTPFTNAEGSEIDMDNLTYHIGAYDEVYQHKGTKWDLGTADHLVQGGSIPDENNFYRYGFYTASTSPKTIVVPGPDGNSGNFSENTFYLQICLGFWNHRDKLAKPRMLDQNITPGTYTCTMTLTAVPSII